ncbi:Uma2 family endonuclease [Roseateles sp. UC29_93]|uniref:Uma2 family endonuclease n=1 Tax=Roseateles sp. UC29_93 TaxID=3350177 RepID=UPI00367211B6
MKSVQEILLIDVHKRRIERHRRNMDATWTTQVIEADGTLTLSSLNLDLPVATVFDQLDLPERALTAKEFLDWDQDEEFRHEFIGGRIVTTDGSKGGHLQAIVHIQLALRALLEGSGRRVDYVDHPEARTDLDEPFFFDIGMFEHQEDVAAVKDVSQPALLVEAHSGTIGRRDRVTRLRERLQRPSLREYVQIDCHRRRMTVHRRDANGIWTSLLMPDGAPLELATIGASLSAETIFRRF